MLAEAVVTCGKTHHGRICLCQGLSSLRPHCLKCPERVVFHQQVPAHWACTQWDARFLHEHLPLTYLMQVVTNLHAPLNSQACDTGYAVRMKSPGRSSYTQLSTCRHEHWRGSAVCNVQIVLPVAPESSLHDLHNCCQSQCRKSPQTYPTHNAGSTVVVQAVRGYSPLLLKAACNSSW